MNKIRLITAIMVCKLVTVLSRLAGNQGSNFPGRLARRICPDILARLARNINRDIFIITGTNGKTTTANMFAQVLKEAGYSCVHNRAGANMLSGITTAFARAANLTGSRRYDYAILETDEANVPLLIKEITPRYILITNFFRDQLDRYGELDLTINMIKEAVKNTGIELLLNADDPLQSHFNHQTGLCCWYYGLAETDYDSITGADSREGRYCIFCGQELIYSRYHYAQLGKFYCPACHNHNPDRNFTGHRLQMNPNISMQVNDISITSPYQGFYNAYNILAAVSLAGLAGIEAPAIKKAIASYQPRAGRLEAFTVKGKKAVLVLVKNPTGLNQSLTMLNLDHRLKNIFIALNDNAADGRDISWIWDADLEIVTEQAEQIKWVICSGQRSGDMAVRVKYGGFDPGRIIIQTDLQEAIMQAIDLESEIAYILCTYTALFRCRQILGRLQKKYPFRPAPEELPAKETRLYE